MTAAWTVFLDDGAGEGYSVHSVWTSKEQAETISDQLMRITDDYAMVEETTIHSEGHIETFVQITTMIYPDGAIVVYKPAQTYHLVPQTETGTLISKREGVVTAIYVEERTEDEAFTSLAKALKDNNLPLKVHPVGFGKMTDLTTYLG